MLICTTYDRDLNDPDVLEAPHVPRRTGYAYSMFGVCADASGVSRCQHCKLGRGGYGIISMDASGLLPRP